MNVHVRHAEPDDAAVIAGNNRATARETEGWDLDPATARQGVEALLDNPSRGFFLLAEVGGQVVGQCMVTYEWSDWRNGDFWWIQSVYVREEFRRLGIFASLYRAIEAEAKDRPDVVGIRLYVDRENRTAQEAYRGVGMQEARYLLFEVDFTRHPDG
jgi:GNAT superfamily N-acetyltransferase